MNEFEAAFFYGDYTVLHELIAKLLSENFVDESVPTEFST